MDMQVSINQYINSGQDAAAAHYSQGNTDTQPVTGNHKTKAMKVLFSGTGKAERNMGLAPIPPLWIPGSPAWN